MTRTYEWRKIFHDFGQDGTRWITHRLDGGKVSQESQRPKPDGREREEVSRPRGTAYAATSATKRMKGGGEQGMRGPAVRMNASAA